MPFSTRARIRTGVVTALSVLALGLLAVSPALPASAAMAASAVPLAQGAAFRLTAASVPAGVPAGSAEEEVKCAVIHLTGNKHEESVHCAEVWFLSDGGVSEVTAENVVFCQATIGNMALADCDFIEEEVQLKSPEFPTFTESGECGTIIGHSDCGARNVDNTAPSRRIDIFDTGHCTFTATSSDTVETSDDTTVSATVTTPAFSVAC
ncbi:MAG TPA: hypothetical protein VGM79_25000 [Streptosporangiaceae bacterium]|jgi:hypothetical protein